MIRHCDGTDPNLVRLDRTGDNELTKVACDCGRTFDDVKHFVIYPHYEIMPKPAQDRTISMVEPRQSIKALPEPEPTTVTHAPLTGLCLTQTESGRPDLRIVHICSRYHEHLTWKVPQPDHRCDCGFTWTDQ